MQAIERKGGLLRWVKTSAEIALLAIIDDILQFQSQYIQPQISGLALVRVTKVPVQAPKRKVSRGGSKQSFSPQLSPYLIFSGAYPPCFHTVPLAFCAPSWLVFQLAYYLHGRIDLAVSITSARAGLEQGGFTSTEGDIFPPVQKVGA